MTWWLISLKTLEIWAHVQLLEQRKARAHGGSPRCADDAAEFKASESERQPAVMDAVTMTLAILSSYSESTARRGVGWETGHCAGDVTRSSRQDNNTCTTAAAAAATVPMSTQ